MRWLKVGVEDSFGSALTSASALLRGVRAASVKPDVDQGVLVADTIENWIAPEAKGGPLKVSWKVETQARPNQLTEILHALFGNVVTTGTGPYTHTFTLDKPKSLTFWVKESDSVFWQSSGVGVKQLELKMAAREFVDVSIDCVARDIALKASAPDPEFSTEGPFVFYEAAVLVSNVALATVKEADVTIDRKIADDEFVLDDYRLHALRAQECEVKGKLTVVEEEYNELRRALFGSTTGTSFGATRVIGKADMVLRCLSGTYQLLVQAPVTLYEKVEFGLEKRERIDRTINFRVIKDLTVELINDVE